MSSRTSNKAVVGITSRSSEQDARWLIDFIRKELWDVVSDVKFLPITNRNRLEWEMSVKRCSIGILYHSKHHGRLNITDIDEALYTEELNYLHHTLGKDKVLVVLDDLENCSDHVRWRILETQPSLKNLFSQILLFTEKGKKEEASRKMEEFRKVFGYYTAPRDLQPNTNNSKGSWFPSIWSSSSKKSNETSSHYKQDQHQKQIQTYISPPFTPRLKLGIFSRSAQSNYQWLVDWLKDAGRSVDVHGVSITNSYNSYYPEISKFSFAILYHTIKQGRLNITDVTDSWYEEELKDLSGVLGKENVIVVIDDLQKTDRSEKSRILGNQSSIGRLAKDLFLFSETKNTENLEHIKEIIWKKTKDTEITQTVKPDIHSPMRMVKSCIPSFFTSEKSNETSSGFGQCTQRKQIQTYSLPFTSRLKLGIFSRSAQSNYEWLGGWLKTTGRFIDVDGVSITNSSTGFYSEISKFSFAILYHTIKQGRLNITDVTDSLYDEELKDLSGVLGKKNVIVVIDDLQKTDRSEKSRILGNQPSIGRLAEDLFLFGETKKNPENLEHIKQIIWKKTKDTDYQPEPYDWKSKESSKSGVSVYQDNPQKREDYQHSPSGSSLTARSKQRVVSGAGDLTLKDDHDSGEPEVKKMALDLTRLNVESPEAAAEKSNETSSHYKQDQHQKPFLPNISPPFTLRLKLGIFSRSAQSNYQWLVDWLKDTGRPVDVHGVSITNSYNSFYSEISKFSFAILYHTIKQGRLNITDVTDSLYDEELKDLSGRLGKENVIVVIDDLQKTDRFEKSRILGNQPSIGRLAEDLFLFDEIKKNTENLEHIKQIIWKKTKDTDYPLEPYDWKSNTSSKSGASSDQDDPQKREDYQHSPSGSSLTARSKERDMSGAVDVTWKDDHDYGEPEVKKMALDLTRLNFQSPEAAAEVDDTIKDASAKLQDYLRKMEEDRTKMLREIERLQTEEKEQQSRNISQRKDQQDKDWAIKELQEKLREKEELLIDEKQNSEKNLRYKDRTVEMKDEVIQEMGRKNQELQKKLREKEELLIDEKQKSEKNLRDKDKTLEMKNQIIQKMEEEKQQLWKYIQNTENTTKQRQHGDNRDQGIQAGESQPYKERSPIPGQEDHHVTQSDHRGRDLHWMDGGSLQQRFHSNTGAVYNLRKNNTETRSLTPENDPIEKMKCVIQQKDEEIQELKTKIKQQQSELDENTLLIKDLINQIPGGEKEKATY